MNDKKIEIVGWDFDGRPVIGMKKRRPRRLLLAACAVGIAIAVVFTFL